MNKCESLCGIDPIGEDRYTENCIECPCLGCLAEECNGCEFDCN